MEKKMTKKEKFEMLKALVKDNAMLVEFIDHEIELLDKKKSQGNAKANEKMEKSVELVYNALVSVGRPVKVSELIKETDLSELANESEIVSPQKVSALLKKLVDSGKVVRMVDKKNTYFSVAI
jgi:predicted DNA-binding transcriptional regulator